MSYGKVAMSLTISTGYQVKDLINLSWFKVSQKGPHIISISKTGGKLSFLQERIIHSDNIIFLHLRGHHWSIGHSDLLH